MPPDPNDKMEELLKACASKRREQSGAPFELHPATRNMLQAEVARLAPRPAEKARKTPFFFRLAFTAAAAASIAICTMILFKSQPAPPAEYAITTKATPAQELPPAINTGTPLAINGPVNAADGIDKEMLPKRVTLARAQEGPMHSDALESERDSKQPRIVVTLDAPASTGSMTSSSGSANMPNEFSNSLNGADVTLNNAQNTGGLSAASPELKKLFADADDSYNSGRYDLAYKRYDQILTIDPSNITARRGQEKALAAKQKYADEAYNTTRGNLNGQSESKWDTTPRKYAGSEMGGAGAGGSAGKAQSADSLQNKLDHIIIPKIELKEVTLREAIDFLKKKSAELDTTEADPALKGVNIVMKMGTPPEASDADAAPGAAPSVDLAKAPVDSDKMTDAYVPAPDDARITLSLTNIPLAEALRYVTSLAGAKVEVDPNAVAIVPLSAETNEVAAAVPSDEPMDTPQLQNFEKSPALADFRNTKRIKEKLDRIIIPKIEFREATVREALDYLRKESVEHDANESDPALKGVNIVLRLEQPGAGVASDANGPATTGAPAALPSTPDESKITLSLANVPLSEALRDVTSLAGLKVKVDAYAVNVVPLSEPTDTLITKEYRVPPGFLAIASNAAPGNDFAAKKSVTAAAPAASAAIAKRLTARAYLEQAGVQFPNGAAANYLADSGKLVVRNTEANLDLVDQIVEASIDSQLEQAKKIAATKTLQVEEQKMAIPGVLTTFQLELQGDDLRIIDADGSTYSGKVVQPFLQKQLAVSNGRTFTNVAPVNQAANHAILRSNNSQQFQTQQNGISSPLAAGGFANSTQNVNQQQLNSMPQQNFSFRAAGINRSINKTVTFEGNYITPEMQQNAAVANTVQAKDNTELLKDKAAAPQQDNNARIQGRAQIGNGGKIDIDAVVVPLKTKAGN